MLGLVKIRLIVLFVFLHYYLSNDLHHHSLLRRNIGLLFGRDIQICTGLLIMLESN